MKGETMNLKTRVAFLESNLPRRDEWSVKQMSDAELAAIITADLGIDESEITDELLEAVIRGEA